MCFFIDYEKGKFYINRNFFFFYICSEFFYNVYVCLNNYNYFIYYVRYYLKFLVRYKWYGIKGGIEVCIIWNIMLLMIDIILKNNFIIRKSVSIKKNVNIKK